MKVSEIKDVLEATVLAGEDQLQKTVVAAGGADLMSDILAAAAKDAVLLTGLNIILDVFLPMGAIVLIKVFNYYHIYFVLRSISRTSPPIPFLRGEGSPLILNIYRNNHSSIR